MAINTLITLKDALTTFVAEHEQLKRIEFEADDFRAPKITEGDEFPVLFVAPIGVDMGNAMNMHRIRIYVYERINDDRSDVWENTNDTSLMLRDIRVWWNSYSDSDIQILGEPSGEFKCGDELDNLVGYYADFVFEIPSHGRCDVPINVIPDPSPTCQPATTTLDNTLGTELSVTSVASGASETIVAPDGSAVNSDATYTLAVPSGTTQPIPNSEISINSTPLNSLPATKSLDINVINTSNNPVGEDVGDDWLINDTFILIDNNFFINQPATQSLKIQVVDPNGDTVDTSIVNGKVQVDSYPVWLPNPLWPAIPEDDGLLNKVYMIYAVIEDNPNEIGIQISSNGSASINWGDGVIDTVVATGTQNVFHVYDYATVASPVLQLPDGRNYKPVLISSIVEQSPFYLFSIWYNNSSNIIASGNVLEFVSYVGNGTFQPSPDLARVIVSTFSRQVLCEHIFIKSPSDNYLRQFNYCKSLKLLELPQNYISSNVGDLVNMFTLGSFNNTNIGDIEMNVNPSRMFNGLDSIIVGNVNCTISVTSLNNFALHSCNISFGNITGLNVTSATNAFGSTVVNSLNSIGVINLPALENVSSMFRFSQIPEVVFTDCSNITNTTDMYTGCTSIQKCIMPGLTIEVSLNGNVMTATALNDFMTSVGTAAGAQTLDLRNNPGSATCDPSIATGKGFTVLT